MRLQGMAILSHYPHPLYTDTLAGWQRHEFTTIASSRGATRKLGKGDHSRSERAPRTECIWISPNVVCRRASDLFSRQEDY